MGMIRSFSTSRDQPDEPALSALAGLDYDAGIAAAKRVLRPVEAQTAHLLLRSVASEMGKSK